MNNNNILSNNITGYTITIEAFNLRRISLFIQIPFKHTFVFIAPAVIYSIINFRLICIKKMVTLLFDVSFFATFSLCESFAMSSQARI